MASDFNVNFDKAILEKNLKTFPNKVDKALTAAMEFQAPKIAGYMRKSARWTDRTTNARSGLFARPYREPFKNYGIDLGHSVSYGIWLEVANNGKYAIVTPTIRTKSKDVMQTVDKLFNKLGK